MITHVSSQVTSRKNTTHTHRAYTLHLGLVIFNKQTYTMSLCLDNAVKSELPLLVVATSVWFQQLKTFHL